MAIQSDFVEYVLELLSGLGGVKARAMFGGYGIYHEGIMVGLIASAVFYLKADDQNRPDFEQAGSRPFTYERQGRRKPVAMSYWEVPPHLFDDPQTLREWAERSHAAAVRSQARRPGGTLRR